MNHEKKQQEIVSNLILDMGQQIRNLNKDRSEYSSMIDQEKKFKDSIERKIKKLENTLITIKERLEYFNEETNNLSQRLLKLRLSKIARDFVKVAYNSKYKENKSLNNAINEYETKLEVLIRDKETHELTIDTINIKLSDCDVKLKSSNIQIRKYSSKIRHIKTQIDNLNRSMNEYRSQISSVLQLYKNQNNQTVMVVLYKVYDIKTTDVYCSVKHYTLNKTGDKWCLIRPSGLKELQSKNKQNRLSELYLAKKQEINKVHD